MDDRPDQSLDKRIERLEKTVEELKRSIDRLTQQASGVAPTAAKPAPAQPVREPQPRPTPAPPPPPSAKPKPSVPPTAAPRPTQPTYVAPPRPPKPAFTIPAHMQKFEYWLNKVGIGLMLFAVVFLFKYSIDQGWLTPPVRVVFGLALGVALIVLGLRLSKKRRHFALVLLGGGIATFYITGFAAFQILELISHPTALGFMVGVTVLSFVLSLHQNDPILSIIGTLGGLGTPFLLYTGQGNLPGLITYTCLVLTGTLAIYFFRGWRVILWLSVVGGWIVFLIGLYNGVPAGRTILTEHWAMQWGMLYAWLAFWLIPVTREVVTAINPTRWPKTSLGFGKKPEAPSAMDRHVHMLSVSTPLIALAISLSIWPHPDKTLWGWIVLGAAVLYAAVSFGLRRWPTLRNLAYTQGAMAVVLFTIAICLLFEGDNLLVALATEATALRFIAQRRSDSFMTLGSNLIFAVLGGWLLARLTEYDTTLSPVINAVALADLWAIVTALVVSWFAREILGRRVYLIGAAVLLGGWFMREFRDSQNIIMVALTLEASALYLVSRLRADTIVRIAAHVSFVLLCGWMGVRLFDSHPDARPILNAVALTDLWLVVTMFAMAWLVGDRREKRGYLMLGAVVLAGWFAREFKGADNLILVILALEASALRFITWKLRDEYLNIFTHVAMGCLGWWLLRRLFLLPQEGDHVFLNYIAASDFVLMGLGLGACRLITNVLEKRVYLLAVHICFLTWLARELSSLNDGQGYVTIAWGVYAVLLLIAGLRLNIHKVRLAALATLFLVVGKLFLVDLAKLETIWRVLLFFGFGGVFLALSYYFQSLWKATPEEKAEPPEESPFS